MIDETAQLGAGERARLLTAIERAAEHLDTYGEVRIRIVSDEAMSRAHARWKGVAAPTDVLTFDLAGPGEDLDVDILLCLGEARRQAGSLGHEPWRELALYAVHGLLHCLGHDDASPEAAEAMHRLEDEVLEAIGVGRTYEALSSDGDETP